MQPPLAVSPRLSVIREHVLRGTSVTFSAMGVNFKATWTNLGGDNILIEIIEI